MLLLKHIEAFYAIRAEADIDMLIRMFFQVLIDCEVTPAFSIICQEIRV